MFTRILNTIRESITKNPNNNNRASASSNNNRHSSESEYSASDSRRPSIAEELQNDNHSMLSKFSASPSMPLGRNNSISEPIPIGSTAVASSTGGANEKRRRSSTLFGISNVTYDDYVQKDLISSSWS
ncbi:uncharacterized protein ATC70_013406 [Mucor velutinosus]|uniref:Uncharacterized protein n=1 Tax=Mucor velutinosus TaxID=708070 RepID=A0AAN7D7C1_9FUNG|nr:hypothetical protein ATC70_013406 [Mucor velutinosus]